MPATLTDESAKTEQPTISEWTPTYSQKIPAPKTPESVVLFVNWDEFCKAVQQSIGRDLGGGVEVLAPLTEPPESQRLVQMFEGARYGAEGINTT